MAVTATVSQEFDVMKDNTTSMMIGGMAGTTTTIKMTISGGDPSNLNPVGGMVNEAGVGGAGGISTQVQVAWANAPMQTVSVEKALPQGSDLSAQVLNHNAFFPERN